MKCSTNAGYGLLDPAEPEAFAPLSVRALANQTEVASTAGTALISVERDPATMLNAGIFWKRFPTVLVANDVVHFKSSEDTLPGFERVVTVPALVDLNVSHAERLPFPIPVGADAPAAVPTGEEPELYWKPQAEGEVHYIWRYVFLPDLHGNSTSVHCQAPMSAGHLVISLFGSGVGRSVGGVYTVKRSAVGAPEAAVAAVVVEVAVP